ncbi:hypothetical protein LLG95_03100 [bacterium]|nr:hypothetical protein [bacterium]
MRTTLPRTSEFVFPVRVDQNGFRPVYKLGNEGGYCSFGCEFCGVGKSRRVTSAENISLFDELHAKYSVDIAGPYHPAIFNRGNVTDPKAFSPATLDHILGVFEKDKRVTYLSLNSREATATAEVLDRLAERRLPFPIHFIFGQESFSETAPQILGKNNRGELHRFIEKLEPYNSATGLKHEKRYVFGLDVNLIYLPELYLKADEPRIGNESMIATGLANELRTLLAHCSPLVPVEVNIHPYYEVEALTHKKADLFLLMRILPQLRQIVEEHNARSGMPRTHVFIGVVFLDFYQSNLNTIQSKKLVWLQTAINDFNRTGV